jgi:large subunit ribosomal protein L21
MYSVVEIKGHQYKVSPGDLIDVEKLDLEEGKTVEFDQVLLIGGEKTIVGLPTVAGAKVKATVVKQGRTRKIFVLKRAPGSYRRKNGHRQCFTGLVITEINDGKGGSAKIDAGHQNAKRLKK